MAQSLPIFFNRLERAEQVPEIHDFELKPVSNDNHVVMILGDMHLANRNQDVNQFQKGFLMDVNQSIESYKNKKVYVLTLGDMTWETYWKSNNFELPEYLREMNKINAPMFNTIGNYDNDPTVSDDWETAGRFREVIGPNYYSFNIGKVHYVVLDNIEYVNSPIGTRNYNARYSSSLMEHNIGAVYATWWWTGALADNHMCKDGTPGGYNVWEIEGIDVKWTYKSIGYVLNYQFRTYDFNRIHLTKEKYAPAYTGNKWNTYAVEYAKQNLNNEVLINVWNYDVNWKVEVMENGVSLPVVRVSARDPLHIISYSAKRLNQNAVPTPDFVTRLSTHLFKVRASSDKSTLNIIVTDCFGNVYLEEMIRPKEIT